MKSYPGLKWSVCFFKSYHILYFDICGVIWILFFLLTILFQLCILPKDKTLAYFIFSVSICHWRGAVGMGSIFNTQANSNTSFFPWWNTSSFWKCTSYFCNVSLWVLTTYVSWLKRTARYSVLKLKSFLLNYSRNLTWDILEH